MVLVADYLKKWLRTARDVIIRPRQFFHEMPTSGGYKEPLWFAIVAILIASLLNAIALPAIVFPKATLAWLASPSFNNKVLISILLLGAFFLYSFFSTLISLPVSSAIYHVLLKICGAHGDFQRTFRVSCYYMAVSVVLSPAVFISILLISAADAAGLEGIMFSLLSIFIIVPILIIAVYSFYILFTGFSLVHDISMKRVVLAIIGIPAAVLLIFIIFISGMIYILGYSSPGGTVPIVYNYSSNNYNQPYAGSQTITAPYGNTPDVDGFYTSGDKWDEAKPISFISGGVNYTVAAKHDGVMLYILIMWKSGPEWKNSVGMYFEQDGVSHDHDLKTGLNDEKYNGAIQYGPSSFADAHYEGGVMETEDGMVRGSYNGGLWVQEWVVPLRSGDPRDIYVDQFPATLGFAIIPWERNGAAWPSGYAMPHRPETWGNLEILYGDNITYVPQPTKLVAIAGAAPVIDGYFTPEDGWDKTQKIDVVSGSADYYTLAAKHDRENLYILVRWQGEPGYNSAFMYFEQDGTSHDHNLATGRSDIKHNSATNYYFDAKGNREQDEKQNGKGGANYSNGYWVYEWAIPLQSGDKDDIYVDQFPSTLGFMVEFDKSFKNVFWPENASRYNGPESWGDLEIK